MKRRDYTQKVIQDSLFELLSKKPNDKITVTKLCEVADINRATFYQYYDSIDDLYEKVLINFYSNMVSRSKSILEESGSTPDSVRRIVTLCLEQYVATPAFYSLLMRTNRDKLHRFIYSQYVPKECDTPAHRMLMDYVMSGGEGVCSQWIAKGCSTPVEELSEMIASFICKCLT